MLKKAITYTDFNDVEHTEDFYFNLTKAEIIELELTAEGNSFVTYLEGVVASQNGKLIMDTFKSIIFKAYGEKSEDGKLFKKSEKLSEDFSFTAAYDVLYVELVTDATKAAEFINGIVPAELAEAAKNNQDPRLKSMEQMQGFRQKQEKPKSTVEKVPDLEAAPAVLEVGPSGQEVKAEVGPENAKPDYGSMTEEELRAHFASK
jgi:hypothetical protein